MNLPVVLSEELLIKLWATVKSTFGAIKVADPTPVPFVESVIKVILINALDFFWILISSGVLVFSLFGLVSSVLGCSILPEYSLVGSTFSGSTIAPACTPVYSLGDSTFSGSTIAPACTPVYSGSGATCSGSTIVPDWVPVYSGFSAVSGDTTAPDCSPVYSGKEAWVSGSTMALDWVPLYSGCGVTCSGSTKAPACTPVYSFGDSTFSDSTNAPACTPVYSGSGTTCSGSTIAPDWTPTYSGSTVSGSTMAPDWTPVYSLGASTFSGSTNAPACTPVYSGFSIFAASTNAPACTPVYSDSGADCSGLTIAPACTSLCSASVSGCSFITWAFLVPFSTILKTGEVVEVETISLETSSLFTENILTTSTFFPNLPSCFTLTVPSAKSGFSWISSWKSIFVSIVFSRYKSSGLFNWPDKTSSSGFNVFTPVFSFGETFSSFFVSRFLCSANCDWEFEDCFSSFVGLVNLVETGFSSCIVCTFDGFSTKFGVTL